MVMTVLDIAKKATGGIGLTLPTALVGGSDAITVQMRELLDDTARDMMDRHDWQALLTEASFTTVSGETQIANIRSTYTDFLRWQNDTTFNRTQDRRVYGAVSPAGWQAAKSRITTTPEYHFRIRGDSVLLFENTNSGDDIYFEYVSNKWLADTGRTTKYSTMTADTDLPLLDDQTLMLGLKWRLKRENGLEYAENYREYERKLQNAIARDIPQEPISLTPGRGRYLGFGQIPDGQFGQ